ncbi:hypothetical protein G5V58_16435 [Nocardioides anomalus]|uniref:Lipoprotein n=1 Tax=Nocardioides anomalus TaxID=2712223 RepID=A0A6G6WGH1_9ACTN|nr:hypothetical protein [Nocardioides anomalus]QIG44150.1 hypothetical protein G5V58_16435 [Nocardioides anomalus]
MARRAGRCAALVAVVLVALAGCGTASPPSRPTGVDELVVPTPSPDPGDFVDGVDNVWFPLPSGAVWTYDVSGAAPGIEGTATARVLPGTEDIAGVATTARELTMPDGTTTTDHYAQDRDGNVWCFGRDGLWRVGEDGAGAGLAMPAGPRLGDGWRAAYAAGVVDVRATVSSLDETVSTPVGRFTDVVALETTDVDAPQSGLQSLYARGVGLVEQLALEGPVVELRLRTGP